MKKFLILILIVFLIFCGFIVYDTYFNDNIPVLTIENSQINVDKLYIYGTHLNILGDYNLLEDAQLVLYNGEFISYDINIENGKFNLSNLINDGLYLILEAKTIDGKEILSKVNLNVSKISKFWNFFIDLIQSLWYDFIVGG